MRNCFVALLCFMVIAGGGCKDAPPASKAPASTPPARVAASNSYLEAAARDVLDNRESVQRLAEPGTCPGHFDIRPSQVNDLRRCRTLLRFSFQDSLDTALSKLVQEGLKIHEVCIAGGMCEPPSYIAACRQVADALVADQLIDRSAADRRLAAIETRVTAKGAWCREEITKTGWSARRVVCSMHQEAFCKWLGLQVEATFTGADSASVGQIQGAVRAGDSTPIAAVIANLPEGRRLADALGKRLNAPVVVFGNFPLMQGEEPSFDELLAANVAVLLKAGQH